MLCGFLLCFFKQKTAYELRISDWSSDVCSSDLQQPVREQLSIYIEAAKRRAESLDHVLIFGPTGLGKTTLSHVIANELGVSLRVTSGPVIEKAGDLAALLTNLQPHDVLFIAEIHRPPPGVEARTEEGRGGKGGG